MARGLDRLRDAAREAEALGGRALILPGDVADAARVRAIGEQVEAELGPIDVWVNNPMATVCTRHVRLDDLREPEPIPRATDFALLIESDEPVVAQHTRLDSRQAANALMTTITYPVEGP